MSGLTSDGLLSIRKYLMQKVFMEKKKDEDLIPSENGITYNIFRTLVIGQDRKVLNLIDSRLEV